MKYAEISAARLVAQRLVATDLSSATDVVEWMTCMQAQDLPGARISVALRSAKRTLVDVDEAMNAGQIVRSWPMRGTYHFTPARDLNWMLALNGDRTVKGAAARRENLNLTPTVFKKAEKLMVKAFSERPAMLREELLEVWDRAGLLTVAGHRYHFIWHFALNGVIAYGPMRGTKNELVLLEDWVKNPRRLGREESIAEWILRFFKSHGPAPLKDFMYWTKLPARDICPAMEAVRSQLHVENIDGVEYFMDPTTLDRVSEYKRKLKATLLLPGFDEFVLGYQDRTAQIDVEHAGKLVPGNNGMFQSTVVHNGRIVGTWRHEGAGKKRKFVVKSFDADASAHAAKVYGKLPK